MKIMLLASVLVVAPQSAFAQSMNAEQFYERATALQKKGVMALFSSDVKLLTNEGKAAGEAARRQRLAAVAAGHKPRYCPPADVHGMDSNEYLKRLSAIPAGERARIDLREATNRILAAKYPCSG